MKPQEYIPSKDIPDLSGRTFLVTGGTSGIGSTTIQQLAEHSPSAIYFTGRHKGKAEELLTKSKAGFPNVNLTFIECDLADFESIHSAAKQFTALSSRLDCLICNAGVYALPPGLTRSGYEVQFGINYVGHALLVKLLLPTLLSTAEEPGSDVRIVSVASKAYELAPGNTINFSQIHSELDLGVMGGVKRYAQSKLANILYTRQLAKRYPDILVVAVHPGIVDTNVYSHTSLFNRLVVYTAHLFDMLSPSEGAYNQLWAATADKENITSGEYYEPVAIHIPGPNGVASHELAETLWEWTRTELKSVSL